MAISDWTTVIAGVGGTSIGGGLAYLSAKQTAGV